jgi:hypothetical protein
MKLFSQSSILFTCSSSPHNHNVRLVCQHLTDCRRQYGRVCQYLMTAEGLSLVILVISYLAEVQQKGWRVYTSYSGTFLRWLVEGCAVEISSQCLPPGLPSRLPSLLSGPSRGSTLQRLWPMQSVIGEEAILCSGTAGFHLVRGPEENCLRH